MKRNQFLAIFLLCLISSHGVIGTTEKIKASVLHRELSGLAHGFSSVSQHVDKVSSLDMSKVPTDRYGNYLIAYPDENGEIQDSKADLFDPENQAKVVAFLKGAAWNGRTSRTSEWGSDDVALSTDAEWGCACETNPTGWYCKNWCATKSKVGQIGSDISEGVSSTWDRVTGRDVTRSAEEMARAEARLDALNDGTHISILEIIGAIAFGLINGMLLGMGDLFRDTFRAMRDDPNCSEPAAAVGRAFKAALHHAGQFFKGMFVSSARRCNNGAACDLGDFLREKTTSFFNAVGDVFVSFKDMCLLCRPLQSLFFAIVTIILIAIIVNVVLFLFPGLGLLVKIIGTVLTLIFGIAFLIKTAKKFLAAINDPSKQGSINLIESVCEFIGFIIAVFVLSGAGEAKKMPDMKRKFESQGLSRKGKVEWTGESQAKLTTLETTVKSAKEGKSITTEINTLRRTTTVDRSVTANSRTGSVRTTTSTNVVDDVTKTTIETTRSRVRTNLRDVGKMIEGRFVKGPGATFNPKSGRWHGPDGRFVKQPVNVWPKWNAKAGRWYNEKGQFTKSPFDANIKWDARPQVQRFRNQETGRFAKTPENPFYMIDEVAHTKVTITHETRLNSASTLTGEVYVFPPSTGPRTIPTSINIPYVVFSDADIARASSDGTDDGSSTIPPPPPAAEEETRPTESEEPAPAEPSACERLTPVAGVCGTPSSCMGSIRPRLCPGSSSNVCCVPVADAPPADRPTDQQEADDSQAPVVPQTPTQQRADDSVIPVTPRRESQQQQQSAPATQQQASAGEETFAVPTEFSKN